MRDFRTFVRAHVAPLALAPEREQKIVEEWAAQLEEIYDALRADGLSDDEAWSDIEQQVRSGTLLSDRLLDDALEVAWLAETPAHRPRGSNRCAPGVLRTVRRQLREVARDRTLARPARQWSPAHQEPRLQRHRRADAGDLPWRQRRDLYSRP